MEEGRIGREGCRVVMEGCMIGRKSVGLLWRR